MFEPNKFGGVGKKKAKAKISLLAPKKCRRYKAVYCLYRSFCFLGLDFRPGWAAGGGQAAWHVAGGAGRAQAPGATGGSSVVSRRERQARHRIERGHLTPERGSTARHAS